MPTRWPPQSPPSRKVRCFGYYGRIAVGAMLFLAYEIQFAGHAIAQQSGEIDREYAIKGAFLYNFGRYVQWPAAAFADDHAPFVIGVLGTERVRERPGVAGLPLPIVAMGSIPHIYRREDLSPGDPNSSCPVTGNHTACFAMSVAVGTEFLQG